MMIDDIFRTVRDLLENSDCVLMGNTVSTEGRLYEDSVANLAAILAMQGHYARMQTALKSMVLNYAQFGRVTESNVRDAARLLLEIDDERLGKIGDSL
jgi:hypothetical protein